MLTELAGRQPNDVRVLTALANVRLARQNWMGAQEVAERIRNVNSNSPLASQILAAIDESDPYSRPMPLGALANPRPGIRIGVPRSKDKLFFGDRTAEAGFATA